METAYYDLSGGINQALTRTDLGSYTKKLYWTDSENIEIYKNRGIIKQRGNIVFLSIPDDEKITCISEISKMESKKLFISTYSGKLYIHDSITQNLTLLSKRITGVHLRTVGFLDGLLVMSESDGLFYIKNNQNYDIVDCNLKDENNNTITNGIITVFGGRVWVAKGSTIYYSALGTYDDFTQANDAGYIRDFYTKTDYITALKPYRDYLAIYKKSSVYLLSGTSHEDFKIQQLADSGTFANDAIVNVQNKQYFLGHGIFPLEEIGELNQIRLGSNIAENIKLEFDKFNHSQIQYSICLHYAKRNQIWYFIPYTANDYLNKVLIFDYVNNAWYKRIIPQNIVSACIYDDSILTCDDEGNIFQEDTGNTFNGQPIQFMWKSPFLSFINPHKRKLIDEFYFLIDDENDNKFKMYLYKDYDGQLYEDSEEVYSIQKDQLYFASDDDTFDNLPCFWGSENDGTPLWAVNKEVLEKAEISGSNYSVLICIEGRDLNSSCSIIGLQFREIYLDE